MFEKELQIYKAKREEFLEHHEGQYVVIREATVIGFYSTEQEAYEAGLTEAGNVPFLVRKVAREEEIVRFPALAVGVVNAST